MSHRPSFSLIVALTIWSGSAYPSDVTAQAMIDAPLTKIGSDLASWVQYFGKEYEIVELGDSKNLHSNDPMVHFWITDGTTTVRFNVNLATGNQFISEIESVSREFLESLEIDDLPFDSDGNSELEHCWDGGCNRLRVHREHDSHLGAVWQYFAD